MIPIAFPPASTDSTSCWAAGCCRARSPPWSARPASARRSSACNSPRPACGRKGRRGIVFDMCCPRRLAEPRRLRPADVRLGVAAGRSRAARSIWTDFFSPALPRGDYLHVFDQHGRRVTRADLDFDAWHDWQAELARRLDASIAFFYGNFVRGVRRAVVDGIEPVDRPSDSIQFELFEYIYHQILRKDPEWVARDLFREHYRAERRGGGPARLRSGQHRLHAADHVARDDAGRPDRAAAGRGRRVEQRQHGDPPGQDSRGHPLPPRDVRRPSTAAAPAPTRSSPTRSTTRASAWDKTVGSGRWAVTAERPLAASPPPALPRGQPTPDEAGEKTLIQWLKSFAEPIAIVRKRLQHRGFSTLHALCQIYSLSREACCCPGRRADPPPCPAFGRRSVRRKPTSW